MRIRLSLSWLCSGGTGVSKPGRATKVHLYPSQALSKNADMNIQLRCHCCPTHSVCAMLRRTTWKIIRNVMEMQTRSVKLVARKWVYYTIRAVFLQEAQSRKLWFRLIAGTRPIQPLRSPEKENMEPTATFIAVCLNGVRVSMGSGETREQMYKRPGMV